jgi:hypothetical protein
MTSRFARFITMVFAAIQFAAPAVASVGEGVFSSRVVDPSSHVEEHGQKDCAPPHSADCAICRYLVDNNGSAPVAALLVAIVAEEPAPVVAISLGETADREGFDARGPPATTAG